MTRGSWRASWRAARLGEGGADDEGDGGGDSALSQRRVGRRMSSI